MPSKNLVIPVFINEDHVGKVDAFDCAPHYWLGKLNLGDLSMHVNVYETDRHGNSKDPAAQCKIDKYIDDNDGEKPTLMHVNRKWFFVSVEPYAM